MNFMISNGGTFGIVIVIGFILKKLSEYKKKQSYKELSNKIYSKLISDLCNSDNEYHKHVWQDQLIRKYSEEFGMNQKEFTI